MYMELIHTLIKETDVYKSVKELDERMTRRYDIHTIKRFEKDIYKLANNYIILKPIMVCLLSCIDTHIQSLNKINRKTAKTMKSNKKLKRECVLLNNEIEKLRRLKTINGFVNDALTTIRVFPS